MALTDNLEAFYSLNGNVLDGSGNGRHGTPTGLTYSDGGALFGSGSKVDIPTLNLQASDISYTLAFMFKNTAISTRQCVISAKSSPYSGVYCTAIGLNESVIFQRDSWGPTPNAGDLGAPGSWRQAVWTYSTSSGYKWWIDGVNVVSGTGTGLLANNLDVIGLSNGNQRIGLLKNIGCWSRQLSALEVADLFAAGGVPVVSTPSISGVTPPSGPASGGTPITITGSNFVDGATVRVGYVLCPFVTFVDSTTIIADTPPGTPGAQPVEVTNPDLSNAIYGGGFTYLAPPPTLERIEPPDGPTDGGTPVTITGTGFQSGAAVTLGGVACTDIVVVDDTTITARTPAGTGAAELVVTNLDDQSAALSAAFTYTAFTRYGTHLLNLLPPGKLWHLEPRSVLRNMLVATGDEFQRVEDRGATIIEEADPRTATETIADWERILSLPDESVPMISAVLAERRVAVVSKLVGRGGQNYAFFEVLCLAAGWSLNGINLFPVLREGFRVDDRCYDDVFAYTMELTLDPPSSDALTVEQFEAVVRSRTHSHIQLKFVYL